MIPTLETERLVLRPLQLEDAEQVQRLFPQWEIVQYLWEITADEWHAFTVRRR